MERRGEGYAPPPRTGGRRRLHRQRPSRQCRLRATDFLLTNPQLGDEGAIALNVLPGQIVQQAAALTDHLVESAPAVVVVGVDLQVFGELVDPLSKNGDLDLRGTSVVLVGAVGLND